MKFYKFALWKAYFDKGYGVTSIFKYLVVVVGLANVFNNSFLIPIFIAYMGACFLVGWIWYKYRITDAENEVQNQYNLFMRQVRKKLKTKNI